MGADPVVEQARRVLRWIKTSGVTDFTTRSTQQARKAHFKHAGAIDPALRRLRVPHDDGAAGGARAAAQPS